MDISKFQDVFNPVDVMENLHIVGCGSVGSCLAELLARSGLTRFHLWDFDQVEAKNIANQMFFDSQIGKEKTHALADVLTAINPDIDKTIVLHNNGWNGEELDGYVFLCLDNIDLRREVVKANQYNPEVVACFDIRTGLHDAQIYAADWAVVAEIKNLLRTMNFSHEEAQAETPVSACGDTLGVADTVRLATTVCVMNFKRFLKTGNIKKSTMVTTDLDVNGVVLSV